MKYDSDNEMFRIAVDLVNHSSRNIFLTGKAGTGKTTFLKYIRDNCPKQMAVVAPTGVAAINAGGVTIHSFFQLPFSPFIPGSAGFGNYNDVADKHSLLSRLRLTGEKKKVIQELELLVIDEISMVRSDTLDAIDTVLRHIRQRRFERFGGVQVLFIGDMFQLPPVVPEQEWRILSGFYNSPYFFDSQVVLEEPLVYIEFSKIYRQNDERFINLLNQVRNNELDEQGLAILDNRFNPAFPRSKEDGYIILTTHNRKADAINAEELQKINSKLYTFMAKVEGDFSEKAYPAEEKFVLKTGSQVMFIKNDLEKIRRYFNGKIGIVTKIEDDKILVQCKDETDEIEVKRETWENIRYSVNKNTRQLEEEVLGSFTQYPLRLAWAITIHKSQGLTFEKAIIDAGDAFAPGQVYVALSRCTNLTGMVLQSKVRRSGLYTDSRIVAFSKNRTSPPHLQNELAIAAKNYQLSILISAFDFAVVVENCKSIHDDIDEHSSSFNSEVPRWISTLLENIKTLQEIALKFQIQMQGLFVKETAETPMVQNRIKAGAGFFRTKLQEAIEYLQESPAVTDSRLHAKEYNDSLREIFSQLSFKHYLLHGFDDGFTIEAYHQRKKSFVLPAFVINSYATASTQRIESPHPLLHQQLRKLRDSICSKKDLPVYLVATGKTIDELIEYLPQTLSELERISGFGKARIATYGQQFLDIITQYSRQYGLSSRVLEKLPKRERMPRSTQKERTDTKAVSFELFKKGKTIDEVAGERGLTIQTIQGHLAHYIRMGEISIDELISREKLVIIEPVINEFNGKPITAIKEKLGSSFSYGDIRLTIAWSEFQKDKASKTP